MSRWRDDVRKHTRLNLNAEMTWGIEGQSISGHGTLVDVSQAGACFRIEHPLTVSSGLVFLLQSPKIPVLPKRARLRWYRKVGPGPTFLCGVIFAHENEAAWLRWLGRAMHDPSNAKSA